MPSDQYGERREDPNLRSTEQKFGFEQKEQKVQKAFWVFLTVFLAAGLLGLFGDGVLSTTVAEGSGFTIEYERFLRDDTPSELLFSIQGAQDTTIVSINQDYIKSVLIQDIIPEPLSAETTQDLVTYSFIAAQGGLITFNLTPLQPGMIKLAVTVQGEKKSLNQFVFY